MWVTNQFLIMSIMSTLSINIPERTATRLTAIAHAHQQTTEALVENLIEDFAEYESTNPSIPHRSTAGWLKKPTEKNDAAQPVPAPTFDKEAFLDRLHRLHAQLPIQTEGAGEFVRRLREAERY